MKKYLLLALLALVTCVTFGNISFEITRVPTWNVPLFKPSIKPLNPDISEVQVYRLGLNGNLVIYVGLTEHLTGTNYKCTVSVRTRQPYGLPGSYRWVLIHYQISLYAYSNEAYREVPIPSSNTYIYEPGKDPWGSSQTYFVDPSQVDVYDFGPM